jgi:hypothetical protein
MMVFNDYTNWSICEIMPYGVARAVNEFCIANNWEIVFLALESLGYHGIAIKKNSDDKEVRIQFPDEDSDSCKRRSQKTPHIPNPTNPQNPQ